MNIRFLEWDSNFFNKKIGEIFMTEDKAEIDHLDQYDLLYVKTPINSNIKIDGFINNFKETKVIFSKEGLNRSLKNERQVVSVFETRIQKEDLYSLAFESGKYSRFKLDNNFSNDEFFKLYKQWIDNSFNLMYADAILVYIENEKVVGFVTYKLYEKYGLIGLISVDSESQGKGIGSKLILAVESELANQGISELRIPTQISNEKACDFYRKLGYHIHERTMINHYWKL